MHQSVLLTEAVDALVTDPAGCYIDATFGRGGHSRAILEKLQGGQLLVIDKDPEAIRVAEALREQGFPVIVAHDSFANLENIVAKQKLQGKIHGILMDLGVSSPQLDTAARGFSFMREGPLDMRMDTTRGQSAAVWLKYVKESELCDIIKTYGEERQARSIAQAICAARLLTPITTSTQLAAIIKQAVKYPDPHKHPATRTFQAIRIYINRELEDLKIGLTQSLAVLNPGGRLVVISFHSLEDRIVKQWMRRQAKGESLPRSIPIKAKDIVTHLKLVTDMPPSDAEIAHNPRARSARMRVAEKI